MKLDFKSRQLQEWPEIKCNIYAKSAGYLASLFCNSLSISPPPWLFDCGNVLNETCEENYISPEHEAYWRPIPQRNLNLRTSIPFQLFSSFCTYGQKHITAHQHIEAHHKSSTCSCRSVTNLAELD